MELPNKVIAITGGGQGLGRAMAAALAAKHANLALIDLNQDKLNETIALCEKAGGSARAYIANIADEAAVSDLFQAIKKQQGVLSGLINNAGIIRDALLVKAKEGQVVSRLSLADWQAVLNVNLTGVFLCAREAATHMIENNSPGVIINISSISRAGNIGQSNYVAAKAGIAAITVTWAKELARYGIRVAAIAPGFIATDMVASMKPDALEKMTQHIPLKRLGTPEEIAHSVVYIFENDYFSGRIIECDGGLRL